VELKDIDFTEGQNNKPGVFALMFAAFEDVAVLPDVVNPKPETDAVAEDDHVRVTGNIIMKQNKKMINVYLTEQTGDYMYKLQGADDSKSFKTSVVFATPNKAKGLASFLTNVKNRRGIVLVEFNNGERVLLGGPRVPARLEDADGKQGAKATDASQGMITIYANDTVPKRIFEGDVMIGTNTGGGSGSGATQQTLFAN
jgi:hypothetical protein